MIPGRFSSSVSRETEANPWRWPTILARMIGGASALLTAWSAVAAATTNELSDAEIEGRRIAERILDQGPEANPLITGILKIREARRRPAEVPVRCEMTVTATNWQTVYWAQGTNRDQTATLTIVHAPGQPNEYLLRFPSGSPDKSDPGTLGSWVRLSGNQTLVPFAGSDFWVADLGLEFLHWPAQRLLKKDIARGQSCYVLESTNPDPTAGYRRVKSWLDIDSVQESGQAAIVQAEAYDAKGKLLKEFWPKDFKKVKGQWQVHEMDIRNVQTGSRTALVFDLDRK